MATRMTKKKVGGRKTAKKTATKKASRAAKKSGAVARPAKPAKKKAPATKSTKSPAGPPSLKQVMADLKAAGTAQNRKVYARHGVTGEQFGVSFGFIRPYSKKLATAHELAQQLWATGNHDARMLACMIADGAQTTAQTLDSWVRDIDNYVLADAFGGLVARTPHALDKVRDWTNETSEYVRRCGYDALSSMLHAGRDVPIDLVRDRMAHIEAEIHTSANRARDAMNRALICIGTYADGFKDDAIAMARRIGPVDVDHGETGCKTPDAASYIEKAAAHREKKSK